VSHDAFGFGATFYIFARGPSHDVVRIEPLLYRVLWVDGYAHADKTYAAFAAIHTKPEGFFNDAVRHMYLEETSHFSRKEALTLLQLCGNLVSFAVDGRFAEPRLLPILADMQLRRLSVDLSHLFGGSHAIDFSNSLFTCLTHLHISDVLFIDNIPKYSHLAVLPALTHLCLYAEVPWELFRELLTGCKLLELLLNLWPSYGTNTGRTQAEHTPFTDPRFVVASMAIVAYRVDWGAGVEGRSDLWAAAETFVSQKRRGDIPGRYISSVATCDPIADTCVEFRFALLDGSACSTVESPRCFSLKELFESISSGCDNSCHNSRLTESDIIRWSGAFLTLRKKPDLNMVGAQ
jgi:hypothetical protein